MGINKNKKGFVFTLLAFFISFLVFSFGVYYVSSDPYTKDKTYREYRITSLNNEIEYFKDIYINSVIGYSSYNVLDTIIKNKTLLKGLDKNYSRLNELVFEGIMNGTLDGNAYVQLENKSIGFFLDQYQYNFFDNHKANFTFDVYGMNIAEKKPYYVSFQILAGYEVVSSIDNISRWKFNDSFEVSVPVYGLDDPEFVLKSNNDSIKIRPYTLYEPELNWTLENFNKTLANFYSVFYMEPKHKYLIGSSFLKRLLNNSEGSYKEVLGFWSFDHDQYDYKVFDSSLKNAKTAGHFGNSLALYNFDNKTINFTSNTMKDLSAYNATATFVNALDCSYNGIYYQSCNIAGNSIYIQKEDLYLSDTNKFAISLWIMPTQLNGTLFNYGQDNTEYINLKLNGSGYPQLQIGSHNGGEHYIFNATQAVSLNQWQNIVAEFDGDIGLGKIYLNGKIVNTNIYDEFDQYSKNITSFLSSSQDIYIGANSDGSNDFKGYIDEIAIYSKTLELSEVARIYADKKAQQIDYVDSLYGKGILFDGKDDYVNIGNSSILDFDEDLTSIEVWIKPNNLTGDHVIIDRGSNTGWGIGISDNEVYFENHITKVITNDKSVPNENKWYHIVVIGGVGPAPNTLIYVNDKKRTINPNTGIDNSPSIYDVNIGKRSDSDQWYFNGIIDEIKIYNRTLSEQEIKQNYHNYNGISKGCCNYITIINPNAMGYNNAAYSDNVSYSSKLFFEHYNEGLSYNMTLYNLTNITKSDVSEKYYNLMFDDCMLTTFSVSMWDHYYERVNLGAYNDSCSNFVSAGIY